MKIQGSLISIRESIPSMKPSEKKIAEFIMSYPEKVINYSVQKLASKVGVSEASIVRFSRTMNCKGFQELKLNIAYDLNEIENITNSYEEISEDGSTSSLIYSISHNNIQSIKDTFSILSENDIEKTIRKLRKARKVAVFGIGASAIVATDFKQKLNRIGRWCEIGTDFDSQATISANLIENDVVLGISNSGKTESIIQSLSIAKDNRANVISLTNYSENPVSKLADFKLFVSSFEKNIRSGAMSSRITMLNVIDILYSGVAGKDYDISVQKLENTRKAVNKQKRM